MVNQPFPGAGMALVCDATYAQVMLFLNAETVAAAAREGVRADLEAVGALKYMEQHRDAKLADVWMLLTESTTH